MIFLVKDISPEADSREVKLAAALLFKGFFAREALFAPLQVFPSLTSRIGLFGARTSDINISIHVVLKFTLTEDRIKMKVKVGLNLTGYNQHT